MPRIVKVGASPFHFCKNCAEQCYGLSDTVEIKSGWRPENWVNPMKNCTLESCRTCEHDMAVYEAGLDACLEALEKVK